MARGVRQETSVAVVRLVTVLVAIDELFPGVGSAVAELTVAVFEITVPLAVPEATWTTRVKSAVPTPKEGLLHVTVPLEPIDGVVQAQPAGAVLDWNVTSGGNGSVSVAAVATLGPPLLTVTE